MADCLVVVLDDPSGRMVRRLWHDLEGRRGAGRAHPDAAPHMTLAAVSHPHGSRAVREALRGELERLAGSFPAFPVTSAGYGVFLGSDRRPVVHLAVTRTPRLAALHAAVVHAVIACGAQPDGESTPEFWRPHVNLADEALGAADVGPIMADLVERGPKHWTIEVDNVTLLPEGGCGGFSVRLGRPAGP